MSLIFYHLLLLIAVASSKANLKFKFVVHENQTQFVDLGARAYIDCRTTDVQNAKVTLWKITPYKPKLPIVSSPDVIVKNGYFFIRNTFSGYFGEYQCQAEDALRNEITKTVRIQPYKSKNTLAIIPDWRDITVLAGKSIKITCETLNPNRDLIKWEFTHMVQKPLQYFVTPKIVSNNILQSVLEVPAAKLGYEGSYGCKRVSRFNTVLSKKHIYVQVIVPKIPTIRNSTYQVLTVAEGKPLNLPCTAIGLPTPTITWEKDGSVLTTCTKIFTHVCANVPYLNRLNAPPGLLIVSASFKRDNNGIFTCKASNMAGVTTKTFKVLVLGPPVAYFPKRQIVLYPRIPHPKWYPVTCYAAKGNPPPTFKWTMKFWMPDGYVTPRWIDVTKARKHSISRAKNGMSSTLTIPPFISTALYQCTAENAFGRSSATVKFQRL